MDVDGRHAPDRVKHGSPQKVSRAIHPKAEPTASLWHHNPVLVCNRRYHLDGIPPIIPTTLNVPGSWGTLALQWTLG